MNTREAKNYMSKKQENRQKQPEPIIELKSPPPPGGRCDCCGQLVPDPGSTSQHLRCPICYGSKGGVGKEKWHARKGNLMRRCYACNQCGFDWTVDVKEIIEPLQIQYQEIKIQTRGE